MKNKLNGKNKKAVYFPLNTNHYSSILSAKIRIKYGLEGYAIYLMILQKLAESKNRKIRIDELEQLAFTLNCIDKFNIIEDIVKLVFAIEDGFFFSEELNESLEWYDAKYNRESIGGKKSAEKLTPEERSERARKAVNTRYKNDESTNQLEEKLLTTSNQLEEKLLTTSNWLEDSTNNKIEINKIEIEKNKIDSKSDKKFSSSEIENSEIDNNTSISIDLTKVEKDIEEFYNSKSFKYLNLEIGIKFNNFKNGYLKYVQKFPEKHFSIELFERFIFYMFWKFNKCSSNKEANRQLLYEFPNQLLENLHLQMSNVNDNEELLQEYKSIIEHTLEKNNL